MAKKITYTIGFEADTSKVNVAINDIKTALSTINTIGNSSGLTSELTSAATAAGELLAHLATAFNSDTGKLDLTKFQASLKASGVTLLEYATRLNAIGPDGRKAFLSVANAISSAEIPLFKASSAMDKLWTTMKNTMRWQLTTSVLNGFVGSILTAYNYAQDLDESLNNIRIVTSNSAELMAEFAKQANTAAKALSSTTTDYTNASLIYYQQGLPDEDVEARTETTIKMANVTGLTAETVSDLMTAIWNNYDDGTRSLESYADAMVALGAATASSSDEIAEGVQQFAAISSTVGLSYDYAVSALATLTAETRQSASVVGTSLRTIFARLQGLSQDETLDDGTTLNKYSRALANIGVDIKEASGDLKDMDDILDETAEKWSGLTQAQLVALANTVAGVRQYTSFIALMDNWGTFQENLLTAQNSEGALQEQQDIYAESWEAARNRVTAAAEDIYDSLFNADTFITIDDTIADVLETIDDIVDGLGGLKGVLLTLGTIGVSVFKDKIAGGLSNVWQQMLNVTGIQQKRNVAFQSSVAQISNSTSGWNLSTAEQLDTSFSSKMLDLNIRLYENSKNITQEEYNQIKAKLQALEALNQLVVKQMEYNEKLEELNRLNLKSYNVTQGLNGTKARNDSSFVVRLKASIDTSVMDTTSLGSHVSKIVSGLTNGKTTKTNSDLTTLVSGLTSLSGVAGSIDTINARLKDLKTNLATNSGNVKSLKTSFEDLNSVLIKETGMAIDVNDLLDLDTELGLKLAFEDGILQLEEARLKAQVILDELKALTQQAYGKKGQEAESGAALDTSVQGGYQRGAGDTAAAINATEVGRAAEEAEEQIKHFAEGTDDSFRRISNSITSGTLALMSFGMVITSISTLSDTITDSSATGWEKFASILTTVSMGVMGLTSGFSSLTAALGLNTIAQTGATTSKVADWVATKILKTTVDAAAASNTVYALTLLTVAAYILPVIAAIGLLTAGVIALTNAYNKDAQEMEAALEIVDSLTESYEEAEEAASELKETISNWNDAVAALDELEQGTDEFKEALEEANAQAKELIETYGLFNNWLYGSNGAIEIDKEALASLLAILDNAANLIAAMLDVAQVNLALQTLDSETTDTIREIGGVVVSAMDMSSKLTAEELNAIAKVVSENDYSIIDSETLIARLTEAIRDASGIQDAELNLDELELKAFNSAVESYIESINSASDATSYYAKELFKTEIESNYGDRIEEFLGEEYSGLTNSFVNALTTLVVDADEEVSLTLKSIDIGSEQSHSNAALKSFLYDLQEQYGYTPEGGISSYNDKTAALEYAAILSGTNDVNSLSYDGSRGHSTVKDSNGHTIFEDMEDDTIRYNLALYHATQALENMADVGEAGEDAELALEAITTGALEKGGIEFTNGLLNEVANGNADYSEWLSTLNPDEADSIKDMRPAELLNYLGLSGLDNEFWEALGYESGIKYAESLLEAVEEKYDPTEYWDRVYAAAESGANSAANLITSLQTGDTTYENIDEDEDYNSLISQLDTLKAEYPELEEVATMLSKAWLVGTEEYIEVLGDLQDTLAGIHLQDLAEEASDASGKAQKAVVALFRLMLLAPDDVEVDITANVEEFEETIDELLDTNYSVDIELHAQAELEFDSWTNAIDDINEKAAMIGANFIVATDDVRELNNTFPGIIDGITDLYNGTVLLSLESVETAIANARADVAEDTDATLKKLQNSKSLLELKKTHYQNIADAARTLASTEDLTSSESATLQGVISTNLSQLEQENSEITADTLTTHDTNIADAASTSAGEVATQWSLGFEDASNASYEFASNVLDNFAAIDANDASLLSKYDYSVLYKGSAGTKTEVAAVQENKDAETAIKNGDYLAARDAYESMANLMDLLLASTELNINDIDGMIAEVGARLNETGYTFDRIKNGLGATSSGSSSDAKTYDTEDLKTLDDIEDRYHEINREIEDQENLLDELDETMDRAYGAKKLSLYELQIKELTKQQELYNEKLAEAKDYLASDQAALADYFAAYGTLVFDENGEIQGYAALEQWILDQYNTAVEGYNAFIEGYNVLTKDLQEAAEEEYNTWKEFLDAAEDLYDERLLVLSNYEDSLDEIAEAEAKVAEYLRDIEDAKLEKIDYELEITVTVKNMKDVASDLAKSIAEAQGDYLTHWDTVAAIDEDTLRRNIGLIEQYQTTYAEYLDLLNNATEYTDVDAILSDIEDLQGDVADLAEELLEWAESLEEMLPDAIDAAAERFAQFTDLLEHNETVLETIAELYELQGVTYKTADGYAKLQQVSQEKLESQLAQAALYKEWYENARAQLLEAEAALEGVSEDDAMYDTLKANRDALLEEYNSAQEAMLESAQNAMETAQEMYTTALEETMYEFEQILTDGTGFDLLQEKYDNYIETESRYLDTVNEAYEVASWYSKLLADIDDTTSSSMKLKLIALQEEIDTRREGNTLSEYDLEILEAKYNVLQAEMALEDAQNAKNSLRLVRDSQGNWNYQYTADTDLIASAQQDLLDAENEWYNIAKQLVEDVTGEIISTWQECLEEIEDIYSDMTLTDEERAERAQEIYEYYTEKIKYLEEEKQIAIADMTEAGNESLVDMALLYGDTVSDLTGLTSEEIKNIVDESGSNIIDLVTADNETLAELVGSNTELIDLFDNVYATDLDNMTSNTVDFEDVLQDTLDQAQDNWEDLQDTIEEVADESGTNLEDLEDIIDDVSYATDECREAGEDAADEMWDQLDAVRELTEGYEDLVEQVWEYIYALLELADDQAETVKRETSSGAASSTGYSSEVDYDALIQQGIVQGLISYGDSTYKELMELRAAKIAAGEGNDRYGSTSAANKFFASLKEGSTESLSQYAQGQYSSANEWYKVYNSIASLDTGGYTGVFGDSKLAFLHEKELVLNKDDTENILAAVNMMSMLEPTVISAIEKTLDGDATAAAALMASRIGDGTTITPTSDVLEQYVTIEHVEFPNVTSSDEILDALASIVNDASQWAQRRKS